MKKPKLLVSAIIVWLLISLSLLFTACGRTDDPAVADTETESKATESETEKNYGNDPADYQGYTVVRSDDSPQFLTLLTVKLRQQFTERGVEVEIATDYDENPDADAISKKNEILVGETNRPESAEAKQKLAEEGKEYGCYRIGNKLCLIGTDDYGSASAGYEFMEKMFGYVREEAERFILLTDYMTDAMAEDQTQAFKKAISAAKKSGTPIFVPVGEYTISESLTLYSIGMVGEIKEGNVPLIKHTKSDGPLFKLESGAMISNLFIRSSYVPSSGTGDAEITMRGSGCQVKNVSIKEPYIGILAGSLTDANVNPGRLYIHGVNVLSPAYAGIYINGCRDSSWISDCLVWSEKSDGPDYAFWLTDNDELISSNLNAVGADIGFYIHCVAKKGDGSLGGYWGTLTQCRTRNCNVGMQIGAGSHKATLTDCDFSAIDSALVVSSETAGTTIVSVSGCRLLSENGSCVSVSGARIINLSDSLIQRIGGNDCPAVLLDGGQMAGLSGNQISSSGIGIRIDHPGTQYACSILNNQITTSAPIAIESNLQTDLRQFEGNLEETDEQITDSQKVDEIAPENRMSVLDLLDYSATEQGHNVIMLGAFGDGNKDDTKAFQRAIELARADGLPVLVPMGAYLISETLDLDGIELKGYDCLSWTSDSPELPRLMHSTWREPALRMSNGATVTGIAVWSSYDASSDFDQSSFLSKSGEAVPEIVITGKDCRLSQVRLDRPYWGICAGDPTGEAETENVSVREVFIVQAYHIGFYMGGISGESELIDSEVWCNGDYGGWGFYFGGNEELTAENLAVFKMKYGFYFKDERGFESDISISNSGADFTQMGSVVEKGLFHVDFSGCTFQDHFYGLDLKSSTDPSTSVSFRNCYVIGNGSVIFSLSGGDYAGLTGCTIVRVASQGSAIVASNMSEVVLNSNCVYVNGSAIQVTDKKTDHKVDISGNLLYCAAANGVETSGSKAELSLSANAELLNQTIG
ncbi:MAG: right-handed parallel beta-helix repeat-containing protein [Clostridia bacterium]|nr:right-handed parallel beta-helix repeat-containing protein [Clostridia bacterium]